MKLVVKLSGKVLEEDGRRARLCRQLARLHRDGHRMVLLHGGGRQLTELSERLGVPVVQFEGRRITDAETLELAVMVFSAINRYLVAALRAEEIPALGIAAFDAGLISCRRRPPISVFVDDAKGNRRREEVDFGLVAEIETVDASVLGRFWDSGWLPVISSLGADPGGQILNVNADTLAAEVAIAARADRLLSVSDVEGIRRSADDPESRIPELASAEVRALIEKGVIRDGMIPKVETALKALSRGVRSVQIVSGLEENAILEALEQRAGTLLTD